MFDRWYKYGLLFQCRRCGDCCRGEPGYVWVNDEEIARMAQSLGLAIDLFSQRYLRTVGSGVSLRELPNGDCVFYRDGCTLYDARPVQCRTFPFWPEYLSSPEAWEMAVRRCPGIGAGRRFRPDEIDALACELRLCRARKS